MADRNNNTPVVPGASSALDQLKYEVASQLGATLGPDRSARENGSVGGEMTKRLVSFAEQNLKSKI
jgi:small acid-soluble spore protein B (major beta-type SASP)